MAPGRGSIVRVGVLVVRLCADELMRARTIRCVVVLVVVDARDGVLRTFAFRFGFVSLGLWVGGRRLLLSWSYVGLWTRLDAPTRQRLRSRRSSSPPLLLFGMDRCAAAGGARCTQQTSVGARCGVCVLPGG